MPKPQSALIADALAAALNLEFSSEFTAARKWRHDYKMGTDTGLKVSVAHHARESSLLTHGSDQHVHGCWVTFQKPLDGVTDQSQEAEIDGLAEMVERVADHMARLKLLPGGMPFGEAVVIDPVCAVLSVEERMMFESVIRVAYREVRAAG